jgi:regulator of replication initiation timing
MKKEWVKDFTKKEKSKVLKLEIERLKRKLPEVRMEKKHKQKDIEYLEELLKLPFPEEAKEKYRKLIELGKEIIKTCDRIEEALKRKIERLEIERRKI